MVRVLILVPVFALAVVIYWKAMRVVNAASTPDETAYKKARENYKGYDAAVDLIEYLLEQDKSRYLFTEDERMKLRERVVHFENTNK